MQQIDQILEKLFTRIQKRMISWKLFRTTRRCLKTTAMILNFLRKASLRPLINNSMGEISPEKDSQPQTTLWPLKMYLWRLKISPITFWILDRKNPKQQGKCSPIVKQINSYGNGTTIQSLIYKKNSLILVVWQTSKQLRCWKSQHRPWLWLRVGLRQTAISIVVCNCLTGFETTRQLFSSRRWWLSTSSRWSQRIRRESPAVEICSYHRAPKNQTRRSGPIRGCSIVLLTSINTARFRFFNWSWVP